MKKHLFLAVSLTLAFGCSPAADNNTTGGTGGKGGSGGSTGGRGGSSGTGGSTGGSAGGSTGGSGGSGGATGGTGGSTGGTGGSGGSGGSTGGTGGSTGGTGGSTGGTGGGMTDAKPSDGSGGGADSGAPAGGVASSLHDQVFKVACATQTGMATGCALGADVANDPARAFEKSFQIGGDPNKVYKVTLKICGVFEGRSVTGCAATGSTTNVCVDGMTVNSPNYLPTYPTMILDVPEPKHIYHLNRVFRNDNIVKHDYEHTFDIKGGTTVVIKSDGGNNKNIYTAYKTGAPTCPNVPGIMQPYLGQFFHIQLVKAE